jgi:hypothetical protein
MRFLCPLSCAAALSITAASARADFPVAIRGMAGPGVGAAWHGNLATGPLGALAAADLLWRDRPGHAFVLSYDTGVVGFPGARVYPDPYEARLDQSFAQAFLIGVERSRPGAGVTPYLQGGLGAGRVASDLRAQRPSGLGVAVGGSVGFRIVPDPGPLGFLLGLRTSHVISRHAHAHTLVLVLGLVLHPR